MKKYKKVIIAYGLAWCMLFSFASLNNKNEKNENNFNKYEEYKKYITSDVPYSDADIFVTFEEIVNNKWYVIETKEDNETDIIMTKKTSFDNLRNGKACYYYKNALSKENNVYRVYYDKIEKSISVQSGPNIINTVSLADYLIENNIAKPYYSEDEIFEIFELVKEKINEKKDINNGDALVKKQNHH